ncbi:hypothetical protein [Cellulomonas sp.]|uniref:hypothetical protein n=1 Tax=Cellulomonas sp. TaxID=40001 RepID=UPI001AFD3B09|nr:hypothetical protein [Cellulomonas sp.]MBO9553176.1 hypothetical protein [Cellulomonas sp.]
MSNDPQSIDAALDRLVAAYDAAGLPPIRPAGDVGAVLAEIRAEIAPLVLPADLERFWQRVDPASITVAPYPRPTDAAFALRTWKTHRDESPGMTPRLLFPVAYESWGFLFVELEDGRGSGGPVFDWAYAGSPFTICFPTLAAYVDLLATMIELDEFVRHELETHSYVEFDPDGRWKDALNVRLSDAQPLLHFGYARELDEGVRSWPEHWLLADGLTPETRRLRGATSTIADLLRRAAAGDAPVATVRALVTSLAGSGAGSRVAIDDGTGVLDVWCPAAVCAYGPSIRSEFEFDVVVRPAPDPVPDWSPEHREAQSAALAHDLARAQAAAMELYAKAFRTTAAAEATAIRPIP